MNEIINTLGNMVSYHAATTSTAISKWSANRTTGASKSIQGLEETGKRKLWNSVFNRGFEEQ